MAFIQNELAFETLLETQTYLHTHRAALFTNPNDPDREKVLDCKAASPLITQAYEEKYRKVAIRGAV